MKKDDRHLTPLERYLARQAQPKKASNSPRDTGDESGDVSGDVSGDDLSAPSRPSSNPSPALPAEEPKVASAIEPAKFLPRFFAYFIDLSIIGLLTSIAGVMAFGTFFFLPDFIRERFDDISRLAVIYFYYGWFYAEKGATPGKLIFNLRVVETGTMRKLSYGRTFFRETLGKLISGVLFFAGFWIAAFRDDRKTLHDIVFDTRVIED